MSDKPAEPIKLRIRASLPKQGDGITFSLWVGNPGLPFVMEGGDPQKIKEAMDASDAALAKAAWYFAARNDLRLGGDVVRDSDNQKHVGILHVTAPTLDILRGPLREIAENSHITLEPPLYKVLGTAQELMQERSVS